MYAGIMTFTMLLPAANLLNCAQHAAGQPALRPVPHLPGGTVMRKKWRMAMRERERMVMAKLVAVVLGTRRRMVVGGCGGGDDDEKDDRWWRLRRSWFWWWCGGVIMMLSIL